MPSDKYWDKRKKQFIDDIIDNLDYQELNNMYFKGSLYLNKKIEGIYDRYVSKFRLSDSEAKNLLNSMTDPTSYDEMLLRMKAMTNSETKRELVRQLEAPAYASRIRQLQETQKNLDDLMQSTYNQEKNFNTRTYVDVVNDSYAKGMFEIQKGFGVSFGFNALDDDYVDRLLKSTWSGDNFSSRIWNNTTDLANTVKQQMLQGILTGKTEREMQQTITKQFAVGAYQARRLIATESAFIANTCDIEAMKEAGFTKAKFSAVLDAKTSRICREHNGRIVDLRTAQSGVDIPPLHPNCRSSLTPYIDGIDTGDWDRRVRDPNTHKNVIIKDKDYPEWYKKNYHDKDFNVSDHDPEKEIFYRNVETDESNAISVKRGNMVIQSNRSISTANDIFISNNASLKRKQLHNIDVSITKAKKMVNGVDGEDAPKFIIISDNEMGKSNPASYDPIGNNIYINELLGIRSIAKNMATELVCGDKMESTIVHELIHWEDATLYKNRFGNITRDNFNEYIGYLNERARNSLESLENSGYNVLEISTYASDSYKTKDYNEAHTEYRVNKKMRE